MILQTNSSLLLLLNKCGYIFFLVIIEHMSVLLLFFSMFSVFDEHVRRSKTGGGNSREMDFESFLDFVLALENKDTPEGLTYLFRCLDLQGRGYLTTADVHTLFRCFSLIMSIVTLLFNP